MEQKIITLVVCIIAGVLVPIIASKITDWIINRWF